MNIIAEDIKKQEYKQIYLIYGEEAYLCRLYRDKLIEAINADPMNFTRFEGKKIPPEDIIEKCETMPFFADSRVILIEDSGFFKEKSDVLNEYLKSIPDYDIIIFVEKEVDKRSKLYKTVEKYKGVCECSLLSEKELINWVLIELKKNGKQIKKSALDMFMSGVGSDLNFISCELAKLISYVGDRNEVTSKDIEEICSMQTENRIFDMINDVASGKRDSALKNYHDLLLLKEPPMRILSLMERQFDQLLRIKELSSGGLGEKLIADKLKLHPYAVKKNLPLTRKYSMTELRTAVEKLVTAEEDVKSGRLTDSMSVEIMLISLSR